MERLVDEAGYPKVRMIIDGGAERADSTAAALQALGAAGIPPRAKLLIHDAVRPFVEQSSIDGCVTALDEFEAATVAFASTDTMLLTEDLGDRKVRALRPGPREHVPGADSAGIPVRDHPPRIRASLARPRFPPDR